MCLTFRNQQLHAWPLSLVTLLSAGRDLVMASSSLPCPLSIWPSWKVVAEPWKTLGFLASRGEEFKPRQVTRLHHSELLCNKVLLKYKRDRESFWHRPQKGAERVPHCYSLAGCYIATQFSSVAQLCPTLRSQGLQHASTLLVRERKYLKTQRLAPGPSPTTCILG